MNDLVKIYGERVAYLLNVLSKEKKPARIIKNYSKDKPKNNMHEDIKLLTDVMKDCGFTIRKFSNNGIVSLTTIRNWIYKKYIPTELTQKKIYQLIEFMEQNCDRSRKK